jgi:toxin ParE1/3/4
MHEYKVIITNHALHSMTEIRDYIAKEFLNPSAAISHLELFRSEIKKLSEMPDRHKLIDEQPWHDEGIRKVMDFRRRGCHLCYRCDLRRKRSVETA